MPGVVHHDVQPAVALHGVVDDPLPGVLAADVQLQGGAVHLVRHRGEVVPGGGDVDGDDGGAVAAQRAGNRCADSAGGTGHDGDLACERRLGVVRQLPGLRSDGQELPVHERRPAGEEEPHGPEGARTGGAGAVRAGGCRCRWRRRAVPWPANAAARPRPAGPRRRPASAASAARRETVMTRAFGARSRSEGAAVRTGFARSPGRPSSSRTRMNGAQLFLRHRMAPDVQVPGQQRGGQLIGAGAGALDQHRTVNQRLARLMAPQLAPAAASPVSARCPCRGRG